MKITHNKIGVPMTYERNGDELTLGIICVDCHEHREIHCSSQEWYNWTVKGFAVQQAFPLMPASQRELLLSGICGECFDKAFKPQ